MARDIHTEIEIDASPEQVWAVLEDLRGFPTWNDTVQKMDGDARVGAKAAAEFKMVNGKTMKTSITVVTVEPNRHIAWTGGIPVMLKGTHGYRIEPLEGGRTKVVHYEEFRGLITFVAKKMFDTLEGVYSADNERLKAHVEAKA